MAEGVLAERVGRQDILLLRGATNRIGARWERDQGKGFAPVDLVDWQCLFELLAPDGGVWYSRSCDAHGPDGLAVAYVPPEAVTEVVWSGRRTGSWRITASRPGVVEVLGWGRWALLD